MNSTTHIAIERAKAEKKNPVVLWLVNIIWPGLGNLVVGQTGLGILFGLLHWVWLGVAVLTLGLGGIFLVINWVVASAVGHSQISKAYSTALGRIESVEHPVIAPSPPTVCPQCGKTFAGDLRGQFCEECGSKL